MKQSIILSMVALSALTVFSCSKSQDALDTPAKGKILVAYTDDNVNTRTALQNEVNVIWNSTDAITGFDIEGIGHQSQSITVDSQNASKATFQFGDDLSVVDDIYCALYPADASATMNNYGVITTTLPVSQVATAGSFGPGANIAVADGGNEDLRFSNGGALLSFTVNNDNVKKVKLTVSGDYNVAGPVYASMDNGVALVQSTYASQIKSVSLEGDFVNGSDYYFVVLPGEYTGLQLDIENAEGKVATLKNKNALTVNRNDNLYIANLPDLTAKWNATPTLPDKVFFKEWFTESTGTMGWSGSVANGTLVADNEDWVFTQGHGADGAAKFGSGSNQGKAVSPSISISPAEYAESGVKLAFKAGAWNGDATNLKVSVSGATLKSNGQVITSVTMLNNAWSDYELDITDITGNIIITFAGNEAKDSRFFLDNVVVYYGSKPVAPKATPNITVTPSTIEIKEEESVQLVVNTDSEGAITYTGYDNTIIAMDGNTVTGLKEGTTSITVNVAESDTYAAASVTVPVTILDKETVIVVPDPETIDITDLANQGSNNVSIVFGGSGSNPAWNATDNGVRCYVNNTVTVSTKTNFNIAKIEITYKANKNNKGVYPTSVSVDSGSFTQGYSTSGTKMIWEKGSTGTNEVVFTVKGTAGNIAVQAIKVTYENK